MHIYAVQSGWTSTPGRNSKRNLCDCQQRLKYHLQNYWKVSLELRWSSGNPRLPESHRFTVRSHWGFDCDTSAGLVDGADGSELSFQPITLAVKAEFKLDSENSSCWIYNYLLIKQKCVPGFTGGTRSIQQLFCHPSTLNFTAAWLT